MLQHVKEEAESKGQAPAAAQATELKVISDKICFACDAGMGSSAMGATTLTKLLRKAGFEAKVEHYAIENLPADVKFVLTQESLVTRVKDKVPGAQVFVIKNFMSPAEYSSAIAEITK